MARWPRLPMFLVVGFVAPLALLAVNLVLGWGGILGTIGLFVWLGMAIMLLPAATEA